VYTINQLASMAGVSVRTLHYYDQIGLLKPSSVSANGYRLYEIEALLRLQQILFYREMEMKLEQIRAILDRTDFDVLTALSAHKNALQARAERLKRLLQTIDNTIDQLKGRKSMNEKGLFEGFSEEVQEKYVLEAEQIYDPETVKASNRRWKAYSPEEKKRILGDSKAVYTNLAAEMSKGVASVEVQSIIAHWHRNMQFFWSPNDEQLVGLAELYCGDKRFRANLDRLDPNLAGFMRDAVKVYVKRRKR
jgi:DNA-binding transcriptional MerR regulator